MAYAMDTIQNTDVLGNKPKTTGNVGEVVVPRYNEMGVMSTDMAAQNLAQDQNTLNTLKGFPDLNTIREGDTFQVGTQSYTKTPDGSFRAVGGVEFGKEIGGNVAGSGVVTGKTETTPGKITYLNLNGQKQELSGESITPESVQSLLDQGYYSIESSGDVPAWATTGDVASGRQQAQANAELKTAQNDINTLKGQLANFTVTDAQLKAQTDAITKLWDARIADMQRVNQRREASVKTLGIRLGNRYTGGEGGVFGGIIAEEERQGVNRVAELEAQKQQAISAAEESARSKNWDVYSTQVKSAEEIYKEKRQAVADLNKLTVENNKKIQEQMREATRDSAIASLISQGVTSTPALLQKLVGKYTASEVSASLKNLLPSGLDDIVKSAAQNGAPQEVIKKILSSASVADAYAAAGNYLQGGSGIVGEYQFYKRQAEAMGQIPVDFNTYQDMDANRKKSIAAASVAGTNMTTKQQMYFNQIVTAHEKSPLIAAADRAITLKSSIDTIKKTPKDGATQLSLIYGYIQALDQYQSAVREGEIALNQSLLGLRGQLDVYASNLENKRILDESTALNIARDAERLVDTINTGAKMKDKQFQSRARVNGVEDAWLDYKSGYESSYETKIGDEIQVSETEAKDKLSTFIATHLEQQGEIANNIKVFEETLGRPATAAEFLQAFPEYQ